MGAAGPYEIEAEELVCAAQLQVMRLLGFTLKEHTHTRRHVTWYRAHCILEIDPQREITPEQACAQIITVAANQALEEFTRDLRTLVFRRR